MTLNPSELEKKGSAVDSNLRVENPGRRVFTLGFGVGIARVSLEPLAKALTTLFPPPNEQGNSTVASRVPAVVASQGKGAEISGLTIEQMQVLLKKFESVEAIERWLTASLVDEHKGRMGLMSIMSADIAPQWIHDPPDQNGEKRENTAESTAVARALHKLMLEAGIIDFRYYSHNTPLNNGRNSLVVGTGPLLPTYHDDGNIENMAWHALCAVAVEWGPDPLRNPYVFQQNNIVSGSKELGAYREVDRYITAAHAARTAIRQEIGRQSNQDGRGVFFAPGEWRILAEGEINDPLTVIVSGQAGTVTIFEPQVDQVITMSVLNPYKSIIVPQAHHFRQIPNQPESIIVNVY